MTHSAPRTIEAGQQLAERYSELAGRISLIESVRKEALARANKIADTEALPLVTELEQISKLLEPWWNRFKFKLLTQGRKSIELGGCEIGSRMGNPALALAGNEEEVLEKLREQRWARPYYTVRYSLAKAITLAGLAGQHGKKLRELGFSRRAGTETFFIKPVAQSATITETAA